MVLKLGKWWRYQSRIWLGFLCALFALTDVCLQPVFAARALLTAAEPENDSKDEGKAKEGEKAADKEACPRHRPRHVHHRHPLDRVALAADFQALPSFARSCHSEVDDDPFGNGIGTRLRC